MATELLFRKDAYATEVEARVVAINDRGGIVLDRSNFYPTGGGQPGDIGSMERRDGSIVKVETTVWNDASKMTVAHVPGAGGPVVELGETVLLRLDWPVRYARMKIHTALHLLSVALPFPVTGGSIGEGEGRLDFDMPDAGLDRDELTARLMQMVESDARISERFITDAELDANPQLVKTMSVAPPRGSGLVRLVAIEGLDLQPCGGTHVRSTGEIGRVAVTGFEKKGRQNRRVRIAIQA